VTALLGFRDARHDPLGNEGDRAGEMHCVHALAGRTAVGLRGRRDRRIRIDQLQVKWNAALAAIDRQDRRHGGTAGKPNVLR
jgi:hypothetical protein